MVFACFARAVTSVNSLFRREFGFPRGDLMKTPKEFHRDKKKVMTSFKLF
jgi:hypothetical protein